LDLVISAEWGTSDEKSHNYGIFRRSLNDSKKKNDDRFASIMEEGLNHHYIWYHVMEHSYLVFW